MYPLVSSALLGAAGSGGRSNSNSSSGVMVLRFRYTFSARKLHVGMYGGGASGI